MSLMKSNKKVMTLSLIALAVASVATLEYLNHRAESTIQDRIMTFNDLQKNNPQGVHIDTTVKANVVLGTVKFEDTHVTQNSDPSKVSPLTGSYKISGINFFSRNELFRDKISFELKDNKIVKADETFVSDNLISIERKANDQIVIKGRNDVRSEKTPSEHFEQNFSLTLNNTAGLYDFINDNSAKLKIDTLPTRFDLMQAGTEKLLNSQINKVEININNNKLLQKNMISNLKQQFPSVTEDQAKEILLNQYAAFFQRWNIPRSPEIDRFVRADSAKLSMEVQAKEAISISSLLSQWQLNRSIQVTFDSNYTLKLKTDTQ